MMGLEGAVLIPLLILASAAILFIGFAGMRRKQTERRGDRAEVEP